MTNQANIIHSSAMPQQSVPPLQAGSKSPGDSALIAQKQQTDAQMKLIKSSGGGRSKRRYIRGGASEIQVPPTPPGSSQAAGNNYKDLTILANKQQAAAEFDSAKSPADTAKIQASKGGSKRGVYKRRGSKRGGSFNKWGCLSGGFTKRNINKKKSRKSRKHKRKY